MKGKIGTEKTRKDKPKIVVSGDIAVDWFEVAAPSRVSPGMEGKYEFNWETYPKVYRFARPGGALLLANFIQSATRATVLAPELTDIEHVPLTKAICSFAGLKQYPYSATQKSRSVYRIDEFKGFTADEKVSPLPVKNDDPKTELVVIDDASNGFRNKRFQALWPKALKSPRSYVILKMSRPLLKGDLWEALQKQAERLTVIITADDLRQQGVKISRRLSWERTAQDFVWQMAANPALLFLNNCDYLIVRFGVDGAILYKRRGGTVESWLFFDPEIGEDGFSAVYPGKMAGIGNAFVAGLAKEMVRGTDDIETVKEGVKKGFCGMRRLWQLGLGDNIDQLDYPYEDIFVPPEECDFKVASVRIPDPSDQKAVKFWCILEDVAKSVEEMAYNFVLDGSDPALDLVPVGQFGNFVTLDRSEIESFSSIKNLIKEYLESDNNKPLSIAVFGPPGSGKSFGVTEVAKSIAPGKLPDEPLEFNLSQFNSTDDLITAFHKVRDVALAGKTPIVFFDEFDAGFNGELGWLKYFLAPMQDGKFRDGEVVHPIGKAIFVFAGGTCNTFAEFSMERTDATEKSTIVVDASKLKAFKDAKGPDFVSRLRGYVNIKGPNPIDEADKLYMIRRAMVLRFQLEKNAKQVFSGKKCLIDRGVLRAFIKVPVYKHGIRSIQSIIEMSVLSDRKSFEQASLPPPEQLELHVNAEEFFRLVIRDVLLGEAREKLAKAIHEKYRQDNKGSKDPKDPAMAPWEKLREDLKESNRLQADHIPVKLKAIGCDLTSVFGKKPRSIKITEEEFEKMAEMEHQRFVAEKLLAGWSQGKERDDSKKIRTDLVEWSELSEKIKDHDRKAVRAIPDLLAQAGFEIYRLK